MVPYFPILSSGFPNCKPPFRWGFPHGLGRGGSGFAAPGGLGRISAAGVWTSAGGARGKAPEDGG